MTQVFYRFVITVIFSISSTAYAAEGFHDGFDTAPPAVKTWAQRVFLVGDANEKPIGTAFLIHSDNNDLHFLTAKHVAELCAEEATCSLYADAEFKRSSLNSRIRGSYRLHINETRVFHPTHRSWTPNNIRISDVGYFKTQKNLNVSQIYLEKLEGKLRMLPLNKTATLDHYIVGYPDLSSRASYAWTPKAGPLKLRWSYGAVLRKSGSSNGISACAAHTLLLDSDADSLPGSSGSPVVDENGELIGILQGGPDSTEYLAAPWFNSFIVPSDTLRYFIGAILLGSKLAPAL